MLDLEYKEDYDNEVLPQGQRECDFITRNQNFSNDNNDNEENALKESILSMGRRVLN